MKRWLLVSALFATPALAHSGHSDAQGPEWSFEPWALVLLLVSLAAYAIGLARLLRRAGNSTPIVKRNALLFMLGWATLAGATVSPLHEGGEHSFTLHMLEHELIMLVAAPLIALSRPLGVIIWSLPSRARVGGARYARGGPIQWAWRHVSTPVAASIIQIAVILIWHVPGPFEQALRYPGWHVVQHLCFLVSALLFWWAVTFGRSGRNGYGLAALCLFVTSMAEGGLGALMTFASSPWYADYAAMGMTPFGLTPQEDQQLAGLVMWIPGGMVHAGAALVLFVRWILPGRIAPAVTDGSLYTELDGR